MPPHCPRCDRELSPAPPRSAAAGKVRDPYTGDLYLPCPDHPEAGGIVQRDESLRTRIFSRRRGRRG